MDKLTGNESLLEELKIVGEIRQGCAVLTEDDQGYHMRDSRNIFSRFRHDLAVNSSPERIEAHWNGFVQNLRAA